MRGLSAAHVITSKPDTLHGLLSVGDFKGAAARVAVAVEPPEAMTGERPTVIREFGIMSAGKEESLSPEEMRQKLYQTFRSRGVLDTLKTHLRNQLIQDLQGPVWRSECVCPSALTRVCNSAIIDHLRRSGLQYTLSIFTPECGLTSDQVLSAREILQLMKISPHTPLYSSLVSEIQTGKSGFLMSLFTELTDADRDRCDSSTQTTSTPAHKESLVEKMQLIDEEYEELRHRGGRWASVEAKLAEYRAEIQEQAQVELKAKMQHFMEVEMAKVKRVEKESSRREILELRREMERTHEMKAEALTSRERNAIERLHKQQEIEEKEIYAQRQALLREIETVRSRETELKQRTEAFDKTCKLQEEKLKAVEDLLRRREVCVKSMEDSFEQKLKSEMVKYQLELKDDYTKRTEKLTEQENRIKAEAARLQKESAISEARAEEQERRLSEVKHLQAELELARSQNERLRARLEDVSDYSTLKRDTHQLQTHICRLEQQLEEQQLENQRIRQELSRPSEDHVALQAELRRLETTHTLDQREFETQKNILHTQLQHEVQQCALLKAQLMECEERTAWINTHTQQLQLQLQQTQQALENEVLRNPKPSLVERSVLSLTPERLVPPDFYVDAALLRKPRSACDGDLSEAGPALRGPRLPWSPSEADSGLVSGALARIRELEQEAERLEEAYRSHQHRAIQAAEDPRLPRTGSGYRVSFAPAGRPVEKEREQLMEGRRTPSPRERNPLRLISPPARRLSSTPLSQSKRPAGADQDNHSFTQERPRTSSEGGGAALVFTEKQISPISSGDFTHTSAPSSPRMKSTTRHSCSPPKLQEIISSSESSPQPEKITLHDLTDPVQFVSTDQECVLERLQDSQPERRRDLQNVQASSSSSSSSSSSAAAVKTDTPEEEEKSWEEERKRREERRRREREEAQEREERELERLKQEQEDENETPAEEKRDRTEGHVTVTAAVIGGGADVANPLQKYMMMLMQDQPKEQSPNKAASENQSQEELLLSDHEHSVGVTSREEPDDDFW